MTVTKTAERISLVDEALRELQERAAKFQERIERIQLEAERRLQDLALRMPAAEATVPNALPRGRAARGTTPSTEGPVGDDAPTAILAAEVERLLKIRPRTFAELRELTGGRHTRVAGVLIQMQRDGKPLANIGTARRAIWKLAKV
jgi:hypothetical protein